MSSVAQQQLIRQIGYNFTPADMYEVEYMIYELGFDVAYNHLRSSYPNDPFRLSPNMDPTRIRAEMDLLNYRNRQPSMKGVYKCRKCLSDETLSVTKQTRSADEPMTVIIRCIHCNAVWRVQ